MRRFLLVFWSAVIVTTCCVCFLSLDRRYKEQKTWAYHVGFLQKRFSEWKHFLEKRPLKQPSLTLIKKLTGLPLLLDHKQALIEASSHPLLLDAKALQARLLDLEDNKILFDEFSPRHFSLQKPVQLSGSDLEKMIQILENESAKSPVEVLGVKFEKAYDQLEGEVFVLSELDIVL